jgi:hypothetical protein
VASKYLSYFRMVDQYGVLHLARAQDWAGTYLCGDTPEGNLPTDAAEPVYVPGKLNPDYDRICPTCNRVAFPE